MARHYDHSKNFSFLMDSNGVWSLSPAYDLTYSSGPNGEESTTVMVEGKNPTLEHLLKLASNSSINMHTAQQIISQCKEALSQWKDVAMQHNISKAKVLEIDKSINNLI